MSPRWWLATSSVSRSELRIERRRLAVHVDEDEAVPDVRAQCRQAAGAAQLVQRSVRVHHRRVDQSAAEIVGPAVMRTGEYLCASGVLAENMAAVLAHRRHDADLARVVAQHQQGVVVDGDREVIADLRDLPDVAEAHPLAVPHGALLEFEPLFRRVDLGRQRDAGLDVGGRWAEPIENGAQAVSQHDIGQRLHGEIAHGACPRSICRQHIMRRGSPSLFDVERVKPSRRRRA